MRFLRSALFDNNERFLALSFIPLQGSRNGLEPVGRLTDRAYGGERVFRRGDFDMITLCNRTSQLRLGAEDHAITYV